MRIDTIEFKVKILIISLMILLAALGVYAAKGLYADGSYFLLKILSYKTYWDFDWSRAFVQIITQTPVVLGIKFGITDIIKLIYLHSFGLIGIPIIVWIIALAQHIKSKYFWTLLIAFSATYLTSGFFAIGEYNLTYALAAYCFAVLLKNKFNSFDSILFVLAAFALLRSYEAMIFMGPFLFAFTVYRLLEANSHRCAREKLVLFSSLFLFGASIIIAAYSILYPRDPANLARAGNILHIVKSGHYIYLIMMIGIYFYIHVVPQKLKPLLALTASALAVFYILDDSLWNSPFDNYEFRSMSGLILFCIFIMTFAKEYNEKKGFIKIASMDDPIRCNALPSLALFLSLVFVSITMTLDYSIWIKNFEIEATKFPGWRFIDNTNFFAPKNYYSKFNWVWSNPSLSIILRGNNDGGILNSELYTGWQPFNPEAMEKNPISFFFKKEDLYILK